MRWSDSDIQIARRGFVWTARCTLVVVGLTGAPGCGGSDESTPTATCDFPEPPRTPDEAGPTLVSAVLDCEVGGDLVPALVVTHPDGDAAITPVADQTITLCADIECSTVSGTWTDDFAGSGVEEYFGSPTPTPSADLLSAVCAAEAWPIQVDISDTSDRAIVETLCASVTDSR